MAVNKFTFRRMYLYDFKTAVNYFSKILSNKVVPGFDNISEEADEVEREVYERLGMSFDPDNDDPADSAEAAHDAGISFYIMADGMKQGTINLFTAGLYHLFEQWFFQFHRRELLTFREDGEMALVNWREAKERLLKLYKVDVETFSSWSKVNELRLIANTVKHADGGSCNELKKLRPELFLSPRLEKDGHAIDLVKVREVFHPLAGEDFYVSLEEFSKYVEAAKKFWDELAEAFDGIE